LKGSSGRRLSLYFFLAAWVLLSCVENGLNDPDAQAVDPVVVEEVFVQAPYSGVDVLFVVDSTGSMAGEQGLLAGAAATFVGALGEIGLDWQIGVVDMDLSHAGALVGRPWILTPATVGAASILAESVLVGTGSPPPAAGFDAVVLALANGDNVGFRRSDAALHVVFVSDGDDQSGEVLEGDPVEGMLGVLAEQEARTARPATASAVVDDGSGACDEGTFDAIPGPAFTEVATESGGVVASVCAGDFSAIAAALAGVGVVGATVFPLQADPRAEGTTVSVDGVRLEAGWVVDHSVPALVFEFPPALGAQILVRYEIAE
jgi:hypothetical protein